MDTDRTDPAMDAGPTILYAVQTVDAECDDMFCPACGVAPHVSSTSPLSVHSTGLAMDVNPDDCPRDVVDDLAVLYASRVRWIPRKMRVVYHMRWEDTNERVRKGQWRRLVAKAHQENKRRSAMRRQGKGGGR